MRKIFLLLLSVMTVSFAHAQNADSTYFTRPYYIGLTGSYTAYVNGALSGSPVPVNPNGLPFGPRQVYWSAGYGAMWAFPFARHMECEIGVEGNYVKGWTTEITAEHYSAADSLRPSSFDFITRNTQGKFLSTRLQLVREVYRRNDFAVGAGLEVWTALVSQKDVSNVMGVQLVGKMYLPVTAKTALQTSVFYGVAHSGTYLGLRVAFCLKGTRVFRNRPKSYYTEPRRN